MRRRLRGTIFYGLAAAALVFAFGSAGALAYGDVGLIQGVIETISGFLLFGAFMEAADD